jgi:ribonuclease HII
MNPTFELEAVELELHGGPVVGVDDSGRRPLAGPVVAAAVQLDPRRIAPGIADGKSLPAEARHALYLAIVRSAQVGIGVADVERIDRANILNATLWAMAQALAQLPRPPELVLIDGNKAPALDCRTRTIVRGQAKCLSIAAASIVARAARDAIMADLALTYPDYGFERHKGYGTRQHRQAIATHGVTPQHRRSFRPVQLALGLP